MSLLNITVVQKMILSFWNICRYKQSSEEDNENNFFFNENYNWTDREGYTHMLQVETILLEPELNTDQSASMAGSDKAKRRKQERFHT